MLWALLPLTPVHTLHSAAKLTHKDVKSGKSETILYKVEMETWRGDTKEKLQSDKLPSEDDNTLILKLAILLGEFFLRVFISQIWFNENVGEEMFLFCPLAI